MGESLLPLALVSVFTAFTPVLARKGYAPAVVFELLGGLAVGWLFSNSLKGEVYDFLAFLGLLTLTFVAGTEVNLKTLSTVSSPLKLLFPVVGAVLSLGVAVLLGKSLLYGVALCSYSVGFLVSAWEREPSLVALVSVGELLSMLGLAVLLPSNGGGPAMGLLRVGVAGFAVFLLFFGFKRFVWYHPEVEFLFVSDDPHESAVRIALASSLVLALLFSLLGMEPALGGFAAGLVLSSVFSSEESFSSKVETFAFGFFTPFFFFKVGASVNLSHFLSPSVWKETLLFLLLTLPLRGVALVPLLPAEPREFFARLLVASAPLAVLLMCVSFGETSGALTLAEGEGLTLYAVLSALIFPPVAERIKP